MTRKRISRWEMYQWKRTLKTIWEKSSTKYFQRISPQSSWIYWKISCAVFLFKYSIYARLFSRAFYFVSIEYSLKSFFTAPDNLTQNLGCPLWRLNKTRSLMVCFDFGNFIAFVVWCRRATVRCRHEKRAERERPHKNWKNVAPAINPAVKWKSYTKECISYELCECELFS